MFYFEQLFLGRWRPCTAPVAPKERTAEGARRTIRAAQEVPDYFRNLTLDQLREVLSPDGRFAAQHRRETRA